MMSDAQVSDFLRQFIRSYPKEYRAADMLPIARNAADYGKALQPLAEKHKVPKAMLRARAMADLGVRELLARGNGVVKQGDPVWETVRKGIIQIYIESAGLAGAEDVQQKARAGLVHDLTVIPRVVYQAGKGVVDLAEKASKWDWSKVLGGLGIAAGLYYAVTHLGRKD